MTKAVTGMTSYQRATFYLLIFAKSSVSVMVRTPRVAGKLSPSVNSVNKQLTAASSSWDLP